MTSKKHWTLRVAGLLFALVLITSCFVGGTFAKYVTTGGGHESARVAKFGVTMSVANDTAFQKTYRTDNGPVSTTITNSVDSNGHENLVAPGTKGSNFVVLSIKGTPEVAVNVKIEASGTDVFLKAGDYPITYTLTKNGAAAPVVEGHLNDIIEYLNDRSGNYEANTNLSQVFGTYTLSWEWKFEGGNDKADTLLGAVTAGGISTATTPSTCGTGVHLILTATVTQID